MSACRFSSKENPNLETEIKKGSTGDRKGRARLARTGAVKLSAAQSIRFNEIIRTSWKADMCRRLTVHCEFEITIVR